ncbi:MAG: ABC transporter ATP-binding protein, partial [Candidatus Zixiibacteriota bacterium]
SVGMVFQSFNLLQYKTAQENVELALYFNEADRSLRKERAAQTLEQLGLADRLAHRPGDLSGGEQQRVAIARALVKRPEILFADEPTGNLDNENATLIAKLLAQLNRDGLTIALVTHNVELARGYSGRIITMKYGKVAGESEGQGPG